MKLSSVIKLLEQTIQSKKILLGRFKTVIQLNEFEDAIEKTSFVSSAEYLQVNIDELQKIVDDLKLVQTI